MARNKNPKDPNGRCSYKNKKKYNRKKLNHNIEK